MCCAVLQICLGSRKSTEFDQRPGFYLVLALPLADNKMELPL